MAATSTTLLVTKELHSTIVNLIFWRRRTVVHATPAPSAIESTGNTTGAVETTPGTSVKNENPHGDLVKAMEGRQIKLCTHSNNGPPPPDSC